MAAEIEPVAVGADGWSEWIHPEGPFIMECCDCGLHHELEFALSDDNKLIFRARRA